MKNVTIQISDDLYNEFRITSLALGNRVLASELESILSLSMKLHAAIIKAMLPKEDAE